MRYEIIEHTADIGIIAYGDDLAGLFVNAALGMFSIMAELDGVSGRRRFPVSIQAEGLDNLLVEWLNELLFVWETENVILTGFGIDNIDDTGLEGWATGDTIDLEHHQIKMGIKAITYHQLKVEREDGYRAQVIFDV